MTSGKGSPDPEVTIRSRTPPPRDRWKNRLFVVGIVLATCGTFLSAAYVGWWLHDRNPGRPLAVDVNRPVTVINESGRAAGTVPNVLGLDLDTARQVMIDAGIDPAKVTRRATPYAGAQGVIVDQQPSPGAPRPRAVVLGTSTPAKMPAVVGRQVGVARRTLADLGARVIVRSRYAPGKAEGLVLGSRPRMGALLPDDATLTVAEAPSSVFLDQLEAITDECEAQEKLTIGGRDVQHAISCAPTKGYSETMEYVLNKRVGRFEATIGLGDRGGDTAPVTFRVTVDRVTVFTRTLSFGESARVSLPIEGALRVRLATSLASKRDPQDEVAAVWGDARFEGGKPAVDALTKESSP